MSILKNQIMKLLFLRTFFEKEMESKINKGNLKLLMRGFLSESRIIYDLKKNTINNYLSDFDRLKTSTINGKYSIILNDKMLFELLMKDYLNIPVSLGFIQKGTVIYFGKKGIDNFCSLMDYLDFAKVFVVKPIYGGGGKGVLIIKKDDGNLFINERKSSIDEIKDIFSKLNDYFISEYVVQGHYGRNLYPHSLNTIRIVTMILPESNKPFIPIAVQRIGNKTSAPTDNWTQGGFSAEINLETGELGKCVAYPINGQLEWHSKHPETGHQIEGKIIPKWAMIRDTILNAAGKIPLKYIGWDVAVTDNGYKVLEGNNCTDVNLLQVHRPILLDERVKKFFKYYHII